MLAHLGDVNHNHTVRLSVTKFVVINVDVLQSLFLVVDTGNMYTIGESIIVIHKYLYISNHVIFVIYS